MERPRPGRNITGAVIGGYRVLREIGSGTTGTVYAASHPLLGRQVAIKVFGGHARFSERSLRLYLEDSKKVNALAHPHLVEMYDFSQVPDNFDVTVSGRARAVYFVTMELLTGDTAAARLDWAELFTQEEAAQVLTEVALAVGAAHDEGVLHRDLKPENIFLALRRDGSRQTKVMDFATIRLLPARKTGGGDELLRLAPHHLAYLAPEIGADTRHLTPAADVYSLGAIAYEMLTGHRPFLRATAAATLRAHRDVTATPPHRVGKRVSAALSAVIMRALAKRPTDRFSSMADFRLAFANAIRPPRISTPILGLMPGGVASEKIEAAQAKKASQTLKEIVARRLAEDRLRLPSMPFVALEGLELLNDPAVDSGALAAVLGRDPLIAARLLQLANGIDSPVDSLEGAIAHVGLDDLRRLLVELSTAQTHLSSNTAIRRSFRELWEHCWVVGLLAQQLGERLGITEGGEATYLAGLLHDLGKLVAGALLLEAERKTPNTSGAPWMSHSLWLRVVDNSHRGIARSLLKRWKMPTTIAEGIATSAAYDESAGPHARGNLVRYANALAERERSSGTSHGVERAIETVMRGRELLGVSPALEHSLLESIRERVTTVTRQCAPSRDTLQRAPVAADPTLRDQPASRDTTPNAKPITLPLPAL